MNQTFTFFPGQLDYLARVGCKDSALIAAGTGCGKSMMTIALLRLKLETESREFRGRALIIAPQGTIRNADEAEDDDSPIQNPKSKIQNPLSQWRAEIERFAPHIPVSTLYTLADYQKLVKGFKLRVEGPKSQHPPSLNPQPSTINQLPPGIYLTYPEAFFRNAVSKQYKSRAFETCPKTWDDAKLAKMFDCPPLPPHPTDPERGWCDSVGQQQGAVEIQNPKSKIQNRTGIHCLLTPSLSTLVGHEFDAILLDEAHLITNLEAAITEQFIRLQPKYRYLATATPIPSTITNLFPLMGWLNVPDWYKGHRRNAAWPYARHELPRYQDTFQSVERDYTQEDMNQRRNPKWRGKCTKISPIISSPARLLKLIKPSVAYCSKEMVNPGQVPCETIDVRVPMGDAQAKKYAHYLNRSNVPAKNPLQRARLQISLLHGVSSDPSKFNLPEPNPKLIAILELTTDILQRNEQVVIVCARLGQTAALERRLREAGITLARIDSTFAPAKQGAQANRFKTGQARVLLLGLQCAKAFSFHQCSNLILGSMNFSYGSFHQAIGRVWRVNSQRPVKVYCVLCRDTIEERQYEICATKGDAATICLKGERVPRDFKPVELGELLAGSILAHQSHPSQPIPEAECELAWPALRERLKQTIRPISPIRPINPISPPSNIIPVDFKSAPETSAFPRRPAWLQRRLALAQSSVP